MSGSGASAWASATRRPSPPERLVRVLGAGQAEALEQVAGAVGVVAVGQAGFDEVQGRVEAGEVGLLRQVADRGAGLDEAHAPVGLDAGPAAIFSSVDLPEPLRPTRQVRSPGEIASSARSISGVPPKVSATSWRVRSGGAAMGRLMAAHRASRTNPNRGAGQTRTRSRSHRRVGGARRRRVGRDGRADIRIVDRDLGGRQVGRLGRGSCPAIVPGVSGPGAGRLRRLVGRLGDGASGIGPGFDIACASQEPRERTVGNSRAEGGSGRDAPPVTSWSGAGCPCCRALLDLCANSASSRGSRTSTRTVSGRTSTCPSTFWPMAAMAKSRRSSVQAILSTATPALATARPGLVMPVGDAAPGLGQAEFMRDFDDQRL